MAENYYSLLGEGFTRAAQLRSRDEKKQMKKAMKYQLLYGLGGKFLGDLISTPFKEPVKRFFNTEAGRQVKAKQTYALSDLERLENIDSDITKSGGDGGPVQGLVNVYMGHVDDRMSSPDMFGPKWEEGPNAHIASSWRASVEPVARKKAEQEYSELRDRIQELARTPSDKRLLELGSGARILSPSLGVKAGRWVGQLFGGKSQADRNRDGLTYILTGDSPDLKGSAWANAATQGFINKSNKAAELYNPDFIRDTFDEMKEGMIYRDGKLVYDEDLSRAWNILSETQKAQTQSMVSQGNVASRLTTSPARLLNLSAYDEVRTSYIREHGRMPNEEEMDEQMTVQSKGMDMNTVVVNNLIAQLDSRSEMVEIRDRLRDDLMRVTASEIRRPGVTKNYYDAEDWQTAIVDQRIDSAYRSWLQLSSSTYNASRLKAINDGNFDASFVGDDADVNIQEALLYGVQRIGEDYLNITNQDQRDTIMTRLRDRIGMPIQDQLRTGSVNQFQRNIFGEEIVEYLGLPPGADKEKLQERVRERLENRNVGKDGDDNSNSLVDHLYGDDGTTPAQREVPRAGRVNTVPTDNAKINKELAKIRTHWQNGEAAEAIRYSQELISRIEADNDGTWRMPAEFLSLERTFMDPEGEVRVTEQEETEAIKTRFRDRSRDPVLWGEDLPSLPPEVGEAFGRELEAWKTAPQKHGEFLSSLLGGPDRQVGGNIRNEIMFEDPKTDEESSFNNFVDLLYDKEGFRTNVYKDTEGKLTVGLGHLLTDSELKDSKVGDQWTEEDLLSATEKDTSRMWKAAKSQAQELGIDDYDFIISLGSVNFQLGEAWFKEHVDTWAAFEADDHEEAIREITDSDWYRNPRTRSRAKEFQRAIIKLINKRTRPDPEHRSISMFGI